MKLAPRGSDSFNQWLEGELEHLGQAVAQVAGPALLALILGGGYGRGEGGVCSQQGQERPYNDLDLFLIAAGRLERRKLLPVQQEFHQRLGVEVDFSPAYSPYQVRHWPRCQMFFDLVQGHRVLWGPAQVLQQASPDCRLPPPPVEASRLLLNRGAGLLWAQRVASGREPAPDADFVRRNVFKAWQALGDALLLLHQRYQAPYQGRQQLLEGLYGENLHLPIWDSSQYARALEFRLAPGPEFGPQPGRDEVDGVARVFVGVFLYCERQRLGGDWKDAQGYLRDAREREPADWRNWLRNLRRGRISASSPRQSLYRRLPGLLLAEVRHDAERAEWLQQWRGL